MTRRKPAGTATRSDGETISRLAALLKPERPRLTAVGLLAVISVGFSLVSPLPLGNAINIIFDGIASKQFPASMTAAQALAGLRAHGQGRLAEMLSAMDITPGTGVDLARLGTVLGLAALVSGLSALFGWV